MKSHNVTRFFSAVVGLFFWTLQVIAQSSGIKTYCNPMDINYQYNFEQEHQGISYRSGADPVIVNHHGEYYLFVTISGGYWHSTDLLHWTYITPSRWPMEDICAPAALSVRDTLYLFQSTFETRPIFYTTVPQTGKLEFYNRHMSQLPKEIGPWDPDIFYDEETDRWFMYWGSSNAHPIYGAELDRSKRLNYKTKYEGLIWLDPEQHGWERFGLDHRDSIRPFIEGAWMTKHNKMYYLQYAAPGTEFNVYANGTYVSKNPLGPFTYALNNPISYKPGGFVKGVGHGNTFQDNYGNYWNTGTPWIAVNWNFERRIAMFPTGFDQEGLMFSNTRFGDFPHFLPTKKWQSKDDLFTGWMLLSYRKPAFASSVKDTFIAAHITDENPRTFWVAAVNKQGESITIDLQNESEVKALQVNYTDYKSNIFASDSSVYTQFKMYASTNNQNWIMIADLTNEKLDRPNAYIELPKSIKARYIRYEHVFTKAPNLAISDIRIFGNAYGNLPHTPNQFTVRRDSDERNAFITWQKVPDAVGYNILWGINKNKLYETYQVFGDDPTELEIRALTKMQSYYFAIEAFNETGVSKVSQTIFCK